MLWYCRCSDGPESSLWHGPDLTGFYIGDQYFATNYKLQSNSKVNMFISSPLSIFPWSSAGQVVNGAERLDTAHWPQLEGRLNYFFLACPALQSKHVHTCLIQTPLWVGKQFLWVKKKSNKQKHLKTKLSIDLTEPKFENAFLYTVLVFVNF